MLIEIVICLDTQVSVVHSDVAVANLHNEAVGDEGDGTPDVFSSMFSGGT